MPLETATTIDELNVSNPASSDGLSQADDHIRLIKSAVKATFPGFVGPLDSTVAEIEAAVAANAGGTGKHADGTVLLPGIGFKDDTDNGLYRIGANSWAASVAGAKVLEFATTGVTITGTLGATGQIIGIAGTVTAPGYTFTGDLNSGIYAIGADNLGLSLGGVLKVDFNASGVTFADPILFTTTSHMTLPKGTTAQEPAAASAGRVRWNTTTGRLRLDTGAAWQNTITDAQFASQAEAEAGTSEVVVTTPLSVAQAISARNPFGNALLHVQDQKASGTDGGSFTQGAWRTRTLNTELTNEISGAALASNQITLPAGTYWIEAYAVAAGASQNHKVKIYNISDTADVLIGSNAFNNGSNDQQTASEVSGRFVLASEKVLQLQHYNSNTQATNGFGRAHTFGVVEVYADVKIWKL